jgi:hypothetical protein
MTALEIKDLFRSGRVGVGFSGPDRREGMLVLSAGPRRSKLGFIAGALLR